MTAIAVGESMAAVCNATWNENEFEAGADHELMLAAQADRAAFAVLYRRYVGAIYGYGYRRLGSREAAEDLTSLVFTRALESLPRFRTGSVRGWLFTIAHHAIANDLRGLAARRNDSLDLAAEIVDSAAGPEAAAIDADNRRTLARLMAQLPERDQRVLELRLAGLAGAEIAEVLGLGAGAVRVIQFRAIARMRTLLERERSNADAR